MILPLTSLIIKTNIEVTDQCSRDLVEHQAGEVAADAGIVAKTELDPYVSISVYSKRDWKSILRGAYGTKEFVHLFHFDGVA